MKPPRVYTRGILPYLRRNPPKHPPSLFELRRVRPSHSSMGLRPWSSAKADKWVLLVDRSAMDYISKALQKYAIAEEGVET